MAVFSSGTVRHSASLAPRRGPSRLAAAAGRQSQGDLFMSLEPRQMMAADLAVQVGETFAPPSFLVPGDRVTLPVVLRNNGTDPFTGRAVVTVRAFAVAAGARAQNPSATFSSTVPLTALASDATRPTPIDFNVTEALRPSDYEFDVVVALQNSAGNALTDEFTADNTVTLDGLSVRWVFGTIDGRSNIAFRGVDADGTGYSLSVTGGGFGIITPNDPQDPQSRTTINISAPSQTNPFTSTPSVLENVASSFAVAVTGRTGNANNFVDLDADISIGSPASLTRLRVPNLAAFNAPALNLTGSIEFTRDDTGNAGIPGAFAGVAGAFTINNLTGSLEVGRVGSFTANDLSLTGDVSFRDTVTTFRARDISSPNNQRNVNFSSTVTSITTRNLTNIELGASANVGTITTGNLTTSGLQALGTVNSFTAGTINDVSLNFRRPLTTFTARSITASTIATNADVVFPLRPLTFTADVVSNSSLTAQQIVTTLSVAGWTRSGQNTANIIAPAIGTFTVRPAPATNPPAGAGVFSANAFIAGGTARANVIDTLTINGTLSGSVFAAGSVGAATINRFGAISATGPVDGAAFVASGTVRAFTANSLVSSSRLWVNSVRTATVTYTDNGAQFELLAGARFTGLDLLGAVSTSADPNAVISWRSGAVGTLAATIRPNVTGTSTRIAAGVDPTNLTRNQAGNLVFTGNTNGADAGLGVFASDTTSRIERITLSGSLNQASANSFELAFARFPTAAFAVGTPPVNITIPNTNPATTPSLLTVNNAPVGLRFFRMAVPT